MGLPCTHRQDTTGQSQQPAREREEQTDRATGVRVAPCSIHTWRRSASDGSWMTVRISDPTPKLRTNVTTTEIMMSVEAMIATTGNPVRRPLFVNTTTSPARSTRQPLIKDPFDPKIFPSAMTCPCHIRVTVIQPRIADTVKIPADHQRWSIDPVPHASPSVGLAVRLSTSIDHSSHPL